MRPLRILGLLFLVPCLFGFAQKPGVAAKPAKPAAAAPVPAAAPAHLPVQRVVLYKTGIGYFEHSGRVHGNEDVTIEFTTGQLNDVLKSLTALDLGNGRVTGVRYNSLAPLSERLQSLRLPVGERTTLADFLAALRGARVEVRGGGSAVTGKLLAVERSQKVGAKGEEVQVTQVTVVTDAGEVRSFELTPATSVRLLDRDLSEDVGRYLTLLGSAREKDVRRMTISTAGKGERELFVGYLSEVPVWKSTYRILYSTKPGEKPLIQGWAIVDNTTAEDWKGVDLSLVSGAPQSFIQDISQPYYVRRPVVAMPESFSTSPQTHAATMEEAAPAAAAFSPGTGGLRGTITDPSGAAVAGARVTVRNEITGASQITTTDARGFYTFSNVVAGNSALFVEAPGFQRWELSNIYLGVGRVNEIDGHLQVGAMSTAIEVTAAPPRVETSTAQITTAIRGLQVEAQSKDLGDMFEYDLKQKITIPKNQSALVPIVQAGVEGEKVTLWTADGDTALRALWLKNTSGTTLDAGTFNVLEDETFAGEGLLSTIKPGERRLLSYAVDQSVHIVVEGKGKGEDDDDEDAAAHETVTRVRIVKGLMTLTREQRKSRIYTVHNADSQPRAVILEHPIQEGWKLADNSPKPEETSDSAYRFRLNVDPGKTEKLTVDESKPVDTEYRLTEVTSAEMVLWQQQKVLNPALEAAFRQLLAKKSEIAGYDAEIQSLQQKIQTIVADQSRLRENMKALKGSPEERALLQRYTGELNGQEDQLATLRSQVAATQVKRDQAAAELGRMAEQISLE